MDVPQAGEEVLMNLLAATALDDLVVTGTGVQPLSFLLMFPSLDLELVRGERRGGPGRKQKQKHSTGCRERSPEPSTPDVQGTPPRGQVAAGEVATHRGRIGAAMPLSVLEVGPPTPSFQPTSIKA